MTADAVVLFEGAGGSTIGLHAAGLSTIGFEFWQPAVDCARANGLDAQLHDLSDPTLDHLVPYAPLWWASPPCQPFSAAGDGGGEFDTRDGFPWLLRLVAAKMPDVLIVENVKGLTFAKHTAYLTGILANLQTLGYHVDWRVLNCADYGVPQTRERCIIIARRDGARPRWPEPTHSEHEGMFTARWVSMAEALGWGMTGRPSFTVLSGGADTGGAEPFARSSLRVMGTMRGAGMIERHGNRPTRDLDQPAFTIRATGGGSGTGGVVWVDRRQNGAPPVRSDRPSPVTAAAGTGQWIWTRPATTIAGDTQNAIRLTIPELAALQGFPPEWQWPTSKTAAAKMIGNAVPPQLAHAITNTNRPVTHQQHTPHAGNTCNPNYNRVT